MKKKLITLLSVATPLFAIPFVSAACNNTGNNNNNCIQNQKTELEQRFDNALFDVNRVLTEIQNAYETKGTKKDKTYQSYNEQLAKLDSDQKSKVEQAVQKYETNINNANKIQAQILQLKELSEVERLTVEALKTNEEKIAKVKTLLQLVVNRLTEIVKEQIFKDYVTNLTQSIDELKNKIQDLNSNPTNFNNFFITTIVALGQFEAKLNSLETNWRGKLNEFLQDNKYDAVNKTGFVTDELVNAIISLIEFQNYYNSYKKRVDLIKTFLDLTKDKPNDFKEAFLDQWDSQTRQEIFNIRNILVEWLLEK